VENGLIQIERTRDFALIKKLAIDPAIFKHVSDDYYPDPDQWQPVESELVRYLVARDGEGPFGFGIFIPDTWTCWKAHFAFLPRSYGAEALSAFREMLGWMWRETPAARIVGEIPEENRRAIRFALRAGCVVYGVNRRSRLRGGVLRDQVCLGISKPE
jgi:RimJ/RimL family protein N-acetyltransferase